MDAVENCELMEVSVRLGWYVLKACDTIPGVKSRDGRGGHSPLGGNGKAECRMGRTLLYVKERSYQLLTQAGTWLHRDVPVVPMVLLVFFPTWMLFRPTTLTRHKHGDQI